MEALHVNAELRQSAKRKNMTQLTISRKANKAHTTVSGYFNSEPTPIGALADLASVLDDSSFSNEMAHKTFGTLPVMDSEIYCESPFALDYLQQIESNERKERKNHTLMILCKVDAALTNQDKDELMVYVNEYLDEMLIEMKLILSILAKTNISFMKAISMRKAYWIVKQYIRR